MNDRGYSGPINTSEMIREKKILLRARGTQTEKKKREKKGRKDLKRRKRIFLADISWS